MTDTIIVGLDGANWPLVDHWLEENWLPTFATLSAEGADGISTSSLYRTTAAPRSTRCSFVCVGEGFEEPCVSSKLYTALATGQPVLVVAAPDADEACVVTGNDASQQVAQGDVEGIVTAITRWREKPDLLDRQSENARKVFEQQFTEEQAVNRYYRVLVGKEARGIGNESAVPRAVSAESKEVST